MAAEDWYRNREWNFEIEAKFREKLRRARQKDQYLRIQASYIQANYPDAAMALLTDFFALGENSESAQAYYQVAEIELGFENTPAALSALSHALAIERKGGCHKTDAWVCYVLLILEHRLDQNYNEALQLLDEQNFLIFPYHRFVWNAARALIFERQGALPEARESARNALQASEQAESGFRYHPKIGLVGNKYPELRLELQKLATE